MWNIITVNFTETSHPNSTIIVIVFRNFDPEFSYILVDISDISNKFVLKLKYFCVKL